MTNVGAAFYGHEVSGCSGDGLERHRGSVAVTRRMPPQHGQTVGSKLGNDLIVSPVAAVTSSFVVASSCRMIAIWAQGSHWRGNHVGG
jgi:hypothetical protein